MRVLKHARGLALAAGAIAMTAGVVVYAQSVKRTTTFDVPGGKFSSFDIGYVAGGVYYLADRSNKAVDMFDVKTHKLKARVAGFAGPTKSNDTAGPNGVLTVPQLGELWAGDGDSTVKVIDLKTNKIKATIPTGGKARADEMAVDDDGTMVIVPNDADDPPFVSIISTKPDHKILAKIEMPNASNGLEQPVWFAKTKMFYLSVPELDKDKAKGAIAVIDPTAGKVVNMYNVDKCQPAGLVEGPNDTLLVGCSQDAVEAGFKPITLLIEAATGKIVKTFEEVGGSDQIAYDPKAQRYYLAARGMTGGPVLGVINAASNTWIANLPTAKNAHSVAVDSASDQVFVPLTPNPTCKNGCVAVYSGS
jgi:DNA-binding beta-propeller fold protein YncE